MKPGTRMSVEVDNMRRFALTQIEAATGGPASRLEKSQYRSAGGKAFQLRTRQRDQQAGGWIRYWFGIPDKYWRPENFFVLVCDLDFALVVPASEWLPHIDLFSTSRAGTPGQARQPHIYWRDREYRLKERLRDPHPLDLNVHHLVNRFDLLAR